jgi:hypothetical protein
MFLGFFKLFGSRINRRDNRLRPIIVFLAANYFS